MNKQIERAFVGGYMTPQQAAKAKALAALHGQTVSGLLRYLIENAAAEATVLKTHNRTGEVYETQPGAVAT